MVEVSGRRLEQKQRLKFLGRFGIPFLIVGALVVGFLSWTQWTPASPPAGTDHLLAQSSYAGKLVAGIPAPEGAELVGAMEQVVTLRIPAEPGTVLDFYRSKLGKFWGPSKPIPNGLQFDHPKTPVLYMTVSRMGDNTKAFFFPNALVRLPKPTGKNDTPHAKLYALARASYAKALDQIPVNYRQSFPIPTLKNKKVYLVFLYYESIMRYEKSTIMFAPTWMQTVDYDKGSISEWREISSEKFCKDFNDGKIGELSPLPKMTTNEFRKAKQELYKILDTLLPAFQGLNNKTDDDRKNIDRFKELFDKISEPSLKPYYEAIGNNWFQWLKESNG